MISRLQKGDAPLGDVIDDAVFLGEPARPHIGSKALQGLGLAESMKWVPDDGFNQAHKTKGRFSVVGNPPNQIFPENDIENGFCHWMRSI